MIKKVGKPEAVAADAAYKIPAITSYLIENEMTPALPYTRPRTKEGFFRKDENYIRCHEFKENGQLDLARSRNGLNDGLEEVYYSL